MTDEPTQPEPTPQQRLEAATEAFQALNKMLPPGAPPFQLPPAIETMATLNALVALLIDQGTVDGDQFLERKLSQMADMTEQSVELARELKRQAAAQILTAGL